jgi:hypothetical protein
MFFQPKENINAVFSLVKDVFQAATNYMTNEITTSLAPKFNDLNVVFLQRAPASRFLIDREVIVSKSFKTYY